MARAQKPEFIFRRNGRVHLNRRGASVQSTTGSRGVRISDINAGYTKFRCSLKSTGYPLHSPVSPSLPFPCIIVCYHISTGLQNKQTFSNISISFRGHEHYKEIPHEGGLMSLTLWLPSKERDVQFYQKVKKKKKKQCVLTLRLLMSYIYMEHLFLMFLDHTRRLTTVGRTPLDE